MFAYSACDSITSPIEESGTEPEQPKSSRLHPPILSSPENEAKNIASSVLLQWQEVSGATDYRIQLATDKNFSSLITDTTSISTSFNADKLVQDTTFFWRINAHKDAPEGLWSKVRQFTTDTEAKAPSAPKLTAPDHGSGNQPLSLTLSWESVSEAANYQVQLSDVADFSSILINQRSESNTSGVSGLKGGKKYHWRVRSVSNSGVSQWSDVRHFTTDAAAKTLSSPVLASPASSASNQPIDLTLNWENVDAATKYQIQVARVADFSNIFIDQEETSNSFRPGGLSKGTEYHWRVRAANDDGQSPWSEAWNFKTEESATAPPPSAPSADIWVSAYMASYNHYAPPGGNWGNLPTDEIDWDAFTHLFYFSLKARADGTLSTIKAYENMNPDRINAIVSAAHNAGKPVLFTVGGWGNHHGFSNAISPAVRPVFISNIVAVLKTWGFDGVDLDMEPINGSDTENYKAFIRELHAALQNVTTPLGSKPLVTAATAWRPDVFSDLQDYFDQINLMTYDFSGAWQGWVSWHNSPVYDGGLTFSNGKPVPSIEGKINEFISAGVPKEKLGIGIDFYGYVWNGYVTDPGQSWTTAPQVEDNIPYYEIINTYYTADNYRWDGNAEAAYLKMDNSDPAKKKFVSYDDEKSIRSKINYTRQKGIGGVIIWELSGGYFKDKPAGQRDPLLQAVKEAVWQ